MEKLDIIKQAEQLLPNSFANATIISQDKRIPLFEFLESNANLFVKDGADPLRVAQDINEKLVTRLNLNDIRLKSVREFIKENPNFIDVIQIGPNEFRNVSDYLIQYALEFMNDDGTLNYAGKTIELSELYRKVLNDEYKAPTLEGKIESCEYYVSRVDKEILESTLDGMNITVREYIVKVLPTKMDTEYSVNFGEKSIDLNEFIKEIVDHQAEVLATQKKELERKKEDEHNKTGDNPGLVSEIQIRLNEDSVPEVTAEIPVVQSSLLTDAEISSQLTNLGKNESVTSEEYYRDVLNKLKQTIDGTTTIHDLESVTKYFDSIVEDARNSEVYKDVNPYINSVSELIANKQRNLIKVNGNAEEYADVLFSEINSMTNELNGFTTLDEYSTLYGKALERYGDALNKGIKDIQLKSAFTLLLNRINEKRLVLEATIGYQSPEVERAKVELNELISNIKQDVLTIEHDANNLGSLAGTEVRLNSYIEKAYQKVEEAYNARLLTETDREYYCNRLRGYSMAIQSEAKIGFGIR